MGQGERRKTEGNNMTHWNHRVFKDKDGYSIRETFYKDGKPHLWSAEPEAPFGETLDELKEDLKRMLGATEQPVIEDE